MESYSQDSVSDFDSPMPSLNGKMEGSSENDCDGHWEEDVFDQDEKDEIPSPINSGVPLRADSNSVPREKKFKCELCDKHFFWPYQLQNHIEKGHPGAPKHCELCGKKFGWSNQLPTHTCIVPPAEARKLSYTCSVCGQAFKRAGILRRHMYKHPDSLKYQCDICDRGFSAQAFLDNHKKIHMPERYKGKKVGVSKEKCQPQRLGNKPIYRCKECDCFFRYPKGLEDHMNVHTGNKPQKCWFCGEAFAVVQSLMSHVTTAHSEAKPYKCESCSATFKRSSTLKQHLRIHTGETPYRCEECGRSFKQNSGLLRHRVSHNRSQPNPCDVCGESFRYRKSLVAHKERFHQELGMSKLEDEEAEPSLVGFGSEFALEHSEGALEVPSLEQFEHLRQLPPYFNSGPVFPVFEQSPRK